MSNLAHHLQLENALDKKLNTIYQGGGQKKIDKLHANNQLTARERIDALLDNPEEAIEVGALAGYDMYTEYGGCPSAGVIVKIGRVSGKECIIVANDSTVKAGAWFPITGKKNLRAQEIAIENKIPIIYLVDSAGIFLPLQHQIFADKDMFGRIFRNNAKLSSMGVPQIAAVMGSCVAGGAYLPIMSDEIIMVKETGTIFLAGPFLVKAAIGETVDAQTLGGADTHCDISGVADIKVDSDQEAIETIQKLVSHLGDRETVGYKRDIAKMPKIDETQFLDRYPIERNKPYDTMDVIDFLVDEDSFTAYRETYGQTIVCGYAKIDGWSVGIVANQRKIVKTATNEMQFGGVIYSDSADKAARFIMTCNQKKVPLVFLQDVTGFMVGSRSEHGGIIKDGAKLVNAMSNSTVAKFTVIIGNSYGAGNYAMCGRAFDPRFMVSWPQGHIAVMGGEQASKVIMQIESKNNTELSESELSSKVKEDYEKTTTPYYAAANLWTDAIIKPAETRKWISQGISISNNEGKLPKFSTGVIQT